jgi:hypothetical protein
MARQRKARLAVMAIEMLGGTKAVAQLFDCDQRRVSNWKIRGLPRDTYDVLVPLLTRAGCPVSAEMFSQVKLKPKGGNGNVLA